MTRTAVSRDQLESLVTEYHHVREEHRRAHPEGRHRRRLHNRLESLERRFERLLRETGAEESAREAWRTRLHHGTPQPTQPGELHPALVFTGRSAAGSAIEVREGADGTYDVTIDGTPVERIVAKRDLEALLPGRPLVLVGDAFRETIGARREALEALRTFLDSPGSRPPYDFAVELIGDGIVDRTFALTPRGRRVLAMRGGTPSAAFELAVSLRSDAGGRARRALERKLTRLVRFAPRPILFARASLTEGQNPALERPVVAKATLDVGGHVVRAHVTAASPLEAIALLEVRLSRQLEEMGGRDDTGRRETGAHEPGEWRHGDIPALRPPYYSRPVEDRAIVRRKTFASDAVAPEEAAWEMRLLDHDFHLFTNAASGEECLICHGPDGSLRLLDVAPAMRLEEAIARLDASDEPFVFFRDPQTRRGCVLYRRYDGHYGVVEPGGS